MDVRVMLKAAVDCIATVEDGDADADTIQDLVNDGYCQGVAEATATIISRWVGGNPVEIARIIGFHTGPVTQERPMTDQELDAMYAEVMSFSPLPTAK